MEPKIPGSLQFVGPNRYDNRMMTPNSKLQTPNISHMDKRPARLLLFQLLVPYYRIRYIYK